jgi:hypothetical protein
MTALRRQGNPRTHRQAAHFDRTHRDITIDPRRHRTSVEAHRDDTAARFTGDLARQGAQPGAEQPVDLAFSNGLGFLMRERRRLARRRAAPTTDPLAAIKLLSSPHRAGDDSPDVVIPQLRDRLTGTEAA